MKLTDVVHDTLLFTAGMYTEL